MSSITLDQLQAQSGDTLIYIGDPLCSWCYGFGPELDSVRAAFPDVPFEMIMGGLRPGGRESMADLRGFLREHWTEVYKATKMPFNFAILDQGDVIYDTEYACRAVVVAGQINPALKAPFFKEVQKAFYQDNILPNDIDAYVQIAIKMGLDGQDYHTRLKNRQSKADTYSEIDLAATMGVRSFPTLIVKMNGKLYIAASGYTKSEIIIAKLKGRGLGEIK